MIDSNMILYLIHTLAYIGIGVLFAANTCSGWLPTVCKAAADAAKGELVDFMMNKLLFYTYLVMAVLCFVVVGFAFYFKRGFLPADLGKLNKMNMIFGIIQKLCWLLIRIGSYVLILFWQ